MVSRKRSCEGIRIIDIKTTYWGSNSCRERIAFTGLMLLKTLRIMSDSLWTVAHQVSVYGISQARILPSLGDLPDRGLNPRLLNLIGRQVLYH